MKTFLAIESTELHAVTGGAPTSGNSGSGNNEQLLTAVQGIQSSLADLGKNQNQGAFGGTNGLLFMTMALAMQRRSNDVVVVNGNRGGHSYYWRSSW